jgi:hypothetical protein
MKDKTDILDRLPLQQTLFQKNSDEELKRNVDYSRLNKKWSMPPTHTILNYYDSVVTNSHQYPNMTQIRYCNPETVPSNTNLLKNIKSYPMNIGRIPYTRQTIPKSKLMWI